jgi:hypothetical protein
MYALYKKGGYRQIITIKCPEPLSIEELKKWWLERADKMRLLSGLKWYTVNFTLDCSPFGKPAFDGFEEMWFATLKELKNAYDHELMQQGFSDIRNRGFDRGDLFQAAWLEENIVKIKGYEKIPDRKGMVRLTGICRQPPGMSGKGLVDWFYQHAARVIDGEGRMIIPGIRWYTHCFSVDSPFGVSAIDGCAENWWDSLEEIKRDFDGEVMKSQLEDREEAIDSVDPAYFQGAWSVEYVIKIPE